MREHHVRRGVDLAEFVIEPAPIPTRLHHDAAGLGQALEIGGERRGFVLVDANLANASAGGIHRGHHGMFLV